MSLDLKVKISTVGEMSGAKAVEAQLERDIGKAKALGKEYSHLEAQLAKVRAMMSDAAMSNESYAGKAKVAEVATMGFGGAISKVWAALRGLAYVIPGVGIAGIVAAITGAVAWMVKLAVGTDDAKKALEDFREKAKLLSDSFRDSDKEAEDFKIKLENMRSEADNGKTAFENYTKSLDDYFRKLGEASDKAKELAMSQAELIADPEERARRKMEISGVSAAERERIMEERATAMQRARDVQTIRTAGRAGSFDQQIDVETERQKALRAQLKSQQDNLRDEEERLKELRDKAESRFSGPETIRQQLAQERRVQSLVSDIDATDRAKRESNVRLQILKSDKEKATQELLNLSPGEVNAARTRLMAPSAMRSTVGGQIGGEIGFRRSLTAIDEQIANNRDLERLNKEYDQALKEKGKLESDLARNILDLSKNSTSNLRELNRKIDEVNELLKSIGDAQRRLLNPSTNNRLD